MRTPVAVGALVVALVGAAAGVVGLVRADSRVATREITVGGLPLLEVSPKGVAGRAPGVVVAHGRAASARLMRGFADTLVARGYVVVLPDFTGHGANPAHLSFGDTGAPDGLQADLDTAVRHLRSLPTVDPARIGLIGHSMGAAAVTRYAAGHPDIRATVAISLRSVEGLPPDPTRPRNLLLVVGGAEMRDFRAAALDGLRLVDPGGRLDATVGDPAAGTARRAISVAGVEHLSVLYATRTHEEAAAWLAGALGGPVAGPTRPRDRLLAGALLLLAFGLAFVPLSLLFPPGRPGPAVRRRFLYTGLGAGLVLGVVGARYAPTTALPLAVGGYAAGFFALVGLGLLAAVALARRGADRAEPPTRETPRRTVVAGGLLIAYAVAAIAVPTHLALTHARPVGDRWWLLPIVIACVAVFLLGAELLSAGSPGRLPLILGVTAVAILGATLAGLGPPFVLLVLPVLVVQLAWHTVWSLLLRRRAAPAWLVALVGAVVVGWPIATTMPLGTD